MKTVRTTLLATAALTLAATAAPLAGLQGPGDEERIATAADLVVKARQISENHQEYRTAAHLYRRAAELYDADPEAADAWSQAGRMAFYARDNRAGDDLRRAGESALANGRVGFAARSFLDAAWLAREDGLHRTALELATRASDLARSPRVATAEREELERRLDRAQEVGLIQASVPR